MNQSIFLGGTRFYGDSPVSASVTPVCSQIPEKYHQVAQALPYYPEFISQKELSMQLGISQAEIHNALISLQIGRMYLVISEGYRGYSRLKSDLSNV